MGTDTIPVLVPYRSDNGAREENWDLIRFFQWEYLRWAKIYLGESPEGPFNISAARNHASAQAGDWDIAIFADADSFVDADTLETAVEVVRRTRQVVIPHSRWVNVEYNERVEFMRQRWLPFNPKRTIYGGTKGSLYVVPREAYEAVNGFDERFRGWGWEDTAFHMAVTELYKPIIQFEGNLWHLEHERPDADINRGSNPEAIANSNHYRNLYKRAQNATQLKRVIAKNRVTL